MIYVSDLTYTGTNPAVADITSKGFYYYDEDPVMPANSKWKKLNVNAGGNNLYNTDGVLTDNRAVDMNGKNLSFTGTGNIGIGTDSPIDKLHVKGNVYAEDGVLLSSRARIDGGALSLRNPSKANSEASNWVLYNMKQGVYGDNSLQFWRYSSDGTKNAMAMTIADNGNVGIGTGTPGLKLHVQSSHEHKIRLQHEGSADFTDLIKRSGGAFTIVNNVGGIWNGFFSIDNSGNVGLGTETPDRKLHVGALKDQVIEISIKNMDADSIGVSGLEVTEQSSAEEAIEKVQKTQKRPQLVFEETGRAVALLRDLFNPTYENIYVNDNDVFKEVQHYVSLIAPEKAGIVKLYSGKTPIFDNFNITKQIKSSFGKTVNYKHGAYLIIEHTEALHVVDVNSGNRTRSEKGQEANALEVNLGAADELARQLRLRDMGGIIVVDFIDMNLAEDRQMLYERMCKNMQKDRARHNILPLSKFGLMQITRQRVRPAMDVSVDETCPTCFGKGKIKSSILFTDQLEGKIDRLVNKIGVKKFYLHVHPYVAAFINQGFISLKRQWQLKYGFGLHIVSSQKLAFLQYEFYDAKKQFIDMKEEIETK